MKKTLFSILKIILFFMFTASTIILISSIDKLNVLNAKYFTIFAIVFILIWLLLVMLLFRKKGKIISKTIVCIITILMFSINFVVVRYINGTIDFVSNMTSIDYETKTYSVMVLNSSSYSTIEDINDLDVGFLSIDNNLNETQEKLKEKISFNPKTYEELGSLILSIYNNEISAIIIDKSFIDLMEENQVAFINESKIIYTFDLKIKKQENASTIDASKEPFILYISGSDSRTTVHDVARSDVNIVAAVNPITNKILLVNVPRDTYVQLHGTTGIKDKLTHAGMYGIDMSKNTMQDLLDINIDYYVKVSFSTLINIVDAIDGIEIYSDKSFTAKTNKKCKISQGYQQLNGECALAFSRERYAYDTGDWHRGENQQAVISSIINKLNNPTYLTRYNELLKAIDDSFETDMSYEEITNMFKYQLGSLRKWKIETVSLDGTGDMLPTYSMGSQKLYVTIPNEGTIININSEIKQYLKK